MFYFYFNYDMHHVLYEYANLTQRRYARKTRENFEFTRSTDYRDRPREEWEEWNFGGKSSYVEPPHFCSNELPIAIYPIIKTCSVCDAQADICVTNEVMKRRDDADRNPVKREQIFETSRWNKIFESILNIHSRLFINAISPCLTIVDPEWRILAQISFPVIILDFL